MHCLSNWWAGCPDADPGQIGVPQRVKVPQPLELRRAACRHCMPTCSWLISSADRLNSVMLLALDRYSWQMTSLLRL